MKIKGFKIGKSKDKTENDAEAAEENAAEQIVEMEEKLNGKTKNLEETAQQLEDLTEDTGEIKEDDEAPVGPHEPLDELILEPEDTNTDGEDEAVGPHQPLDELTIEPEDKLAEIDEDEPETDLPEGAGEIKVVEVKAGSEPAPEGESEPNTDDLSNDSINSLFADDEEEENPLANLIRAIPDVTANELVDDLEEIQGIIKEWQKG